MDAASAWGSGPLLAGASDVGRWVWISVASRMAAAWVVVLGDLSEADGVPLSMQQVMSAVEQLVSPDDLAAAVEAVRELLLPPEKTTTVALHLLQVIHVEAYRRMIGIQLNMGASRRAVACKVFSVISVCSTRSTP